ncbi:hypothetical protein O181_060001 [Austropuccinia psidii MF-1]|uniref:Uncharacterized protein n=1 Tax=Austropuccinia psidii MF-1 TaxID=1389203 RepID=A0A9Q3HW67_9BASI|nr:hypothetical protein [Austropuccinia psidii MF-1]
MGPSVSVYTQLQQSQGIKENTHRGILQETPSFPSKSGQTILPDRRGQVPLQKEDYHPTRNSGNGRLPWNCEENHQARNIRLNGNDPRQGLVRFKNQTADKDKWFTEDAIPNGNLHLRRLKASRRTEQSHK